MQVYQIRIEENCLTLMSGSQKVTREAGEAANGDSEAIRGCKSQAEQLKEQGTKLKKLY